MILITLDGLDGSGLTTQARILTSALNNIGINSKYLKNPNPESPFEAGIRYLLAKSCAHTEFFGDLLVADRLWVVNHIIRDPSNNATVFIADRWNFSIQAYQDGRVSIPKEVPEGSVNIFLRVTPEESTRRMLRTRPELDSFEKDTKFRKAVFSRFQNLAKDGDMLCVDGEQCQQNVAKQLLQISQDFILRNKHLLVDSSL